MRSPRLVVSALACVLAARAGARESPAGPAAGEQVQGFVAIRAGAAVPLGNARPRVPMSDLVSGAVPVGLELAARGGQTTLGVLVEYGRAFVADCPVSAPCSGSVVRAGIEILYRFTKGPGGSGWLGAGLGWEGTKVTRAGRTTRFDALELLNLQAGRDFSAGAVRLGPFLAVTFAQGMQQDGKDLDQKSPHAWLQAGIRVELGR